MSRELTDEQALAAKQFIPAYLDYKTGIWYLADRWADGDAGWRWQWCVWDDDVKIWNAIESDDVPEWLREDVEGY